MDLTTLRRVEGAKMSKLEIEKLMHSTKQLFWGYLNAFVHDCRSTDIIILTVEFTLVMFN